MNAWPLDEGLIDYVDASYGGESGENPLYTANVHRQQPDCLRWRNHRRLPNHPRTAGRNVARGRWDRSQRRTGYHAIEFLLWGQDLNGTEAGNGNRPWTDYAKGEACTNGNCDRRAQYLEAATDLLVDDLAWMAAQWRRMARRARR